MSDAFHALDAARVEIAMTRQEGRRLLDLNLPVFRELLDLPAEVSQLTQLTEVALDYSKVFDISPLAPLTRLERLWLKRTPVRNLAPLAGLTRLRRLDLADTNAEDITPLAALPDLHLLVLDRSDVQDLTPLANLPTLHRSPERCTISFHDIPATRADPALAAISRIGYDAERARALLDHLT